MEKDSIDKNFLHEISSSQLAFLGDSVFETFVREGLILKSLEKVGELSENADVYTCAKAQAKILDDLYDMLDECELSYIKRGKNMKHKNFPKSASVEEYRKATGLECLFGYLYLTGQYERINQLFKTII